MKRKNQRRSRVKCRHRVSEDRSTVARTVVVTLTATVGVKIRFRYCLVHCVMGFVQMLRTKYFVSYEAKYVENRNSKKGLPFGHEGR